MLDIHPTGRSAIAGLRSLARNVGVDEDDVILFYEEELQRLQSQARVTKYVDVIAEKHTKDQVRRVLPRPR